MTSSVGVRSSTLLLSTSAGASLPLSSSDSVSLSLPSIGGASNLSLASSTAITSVSSISSPAALSTSVTTAASVSSSVPSSIVSTTAATLSSISPAVPVAPVTPSSAASGSSSFASSVPVSSSASSGSVRLTSPVGSSTSISSPDPSLSSVESSRPSVTSASGSTIHSPVHSESSTVKLSASSFVMAGQSVSKGATPTGTSATVSASQGSTADATTKASATASPDTSSSQAAHTSQNPAPPVSPASATSSAATPSSSAVNSATASPSQTSTEKAATTTAGGDATRTSGSGSGTQIAIPSHTTNSETDALTTSVQGGTAVMGASGTPTSAAVEQSSSAPSAISATSLSNVNSSKGTSGVAQAPKQQAPNQNPAETTSTVTDKPETTLSTPVFLTVTNAHNQTTLSEPPVLTSVGVTTSNGQVVSITHVIANPTGIWGVNAAESSHGFFSNSGAVAGVFLVVGIVIAALGVGICLFIRRRRRRNPRFIESISRPLPMPDNPFEDPRSLSPAPQMRYASGYTDRTLVIGGAGTPTPTPARSPFSSDVDHGSLTSSQTHTSGEPLSGLGLAGIGAGGGRRYSSGTQSSSGSRSRRSSQQGSIGLAITSDHARDASRSARRETSSAQSSPSIYPPSLPALPGEENRSMVNVPLSNNNSTAHLSTTSTNRISSPTTRKPVPLHDLPEPIAPKPLSPMQREAQQTKPPVIPPRSPLRRNCTANSRSLSRSPPPPALASIQTQLKTPDLGNPYEPLTPPISFASLSPPGSSSGHEPPTPNTPAGVNAAANPFSDIHAQQPTQVDIVTAFPMVRSGKRETFYTRTGGSQRRPSVEWRHRD